MNKLQVTTSAALFYDASTSDSVPLAWLERASKEFHDFGLWPILFSASGCNEFLLEDCYVAATPGEDLEMWGETISARVDSLKEGLQRGCIHGLRLDCPRIDSESRSDWRLAMSVHPSELFSGADTELAPNPATLLRRMVEMWQDLYTFRYGFAYKMPLAEQPDCYARGVVRTTFSQVRTWLQDHKKPLPESPDDRWNEEIRGRQRYLKGLFRGAYPASVLSREHVKNADLMTAGIGTLSEIGDDCWLWEVPLDKIDQAEVFLRAKQLLVWQTD